MEEEARPSKKPRGAAGSGLTAFALRTAKQLAEGEGADGCSKNKNLVFSPLSIYAALALVAAGARGATLDELLALLGAPSRDELAEFARGVAERALADLSGSGGPLVAFACGVWHEKTLPLKPAYCAAAIETYRAETRAADFKNKAEAREEINSWVSEATKSLISSILPPDSVHSTTGLVLASAVYFKGMWSLPFDKKETETRQFRLLDGSHVRTPFMKNRRRSYQAVRSCDGFKVLKLAYLPYQMPTRHCYGPNKQQDEKLPRFSMCVFLPNANDGLPRLVDRMAASGPSFLWDHLPNVRVKVGEFWLPKFKLSFSGELDRVLKAMGVEAAFNELRVDLSDMLEDSVPLVVEQVFHKAVIEVDEEGTVAAGFSAGSSRTLQTARRDVDFVADHPFAFFVVEEASGAVVFMGHVLDPTASSSD
ncbi:unnamed protein product [Urochloa decumbens]|uniref:Serpin domain-containing protein n=1 Tax=Urochloa decumbens TaxID=240449 RepID=A0ABC8YZ62_9POAL